MYTSALPDTALALAISAGKLTEITLNEFGESHLGYVRVVDEGTDDDLPRDLPGPGLGVLVYRERSRQRREMFPSDLHLPA